MTTATLNQHALADLVHALMTNDGPPFLAVTAGTSEVYATTRSGGGVRFRESANSHPDYPLFNLEFIRLGKSHTTAGMSLAGAVGLAVAFG